MPPGTKVQMDTDPSRTGIVVERPTDPDAGVAVGETAWVKWDQDRYGTTEVPISQLRVRG